MQPRDAVLVDVEVLADQLAQQPVRRRRPRSSATRSPACSTARRARSASCGDPGQHPLALGPLAPAAIRLLARPRRSRTPSPSSSARRRLCVDARRPRRAACARRDERAGPCPASPPRRASASSRRSAPPARPASRAPRPARSVFSSASALLADAATTAPGTSSTTSDASPRDRPAARARSSSADPTRSASIAGSSESAGAILQQHHLRQLRRRDRRPPDPRRITRREILIAHDPITMLGQQPRRTTPPATAEQLRRIKEPDLTRPPSRACPKWSQTTRTDPRLFQESSSGVRGGPRPARARPRPRLVSRRASPVR